VKRERKGKLSVADLQAAGVTPGLVMRLVNVPANKAQRTGAKRRRPVQTPSKNFTRGANKRLY
jgi:hypothetical protein